MQWIEKGHFNGYGVWVAELPREEKEKWVASIEARPRIGYAAPVGSHMVPGKFATTEEAVEAAHKYIVEMKQGKQ